MHYCNLLCVFSSLKCTQHCEAYTTLSDDLRMHYIKKLAVKTVVTCTGEIIHKLQKCFRVVDFPKFVAKCFILHVTTSYYRHVINMLKHWQKCFSVLFYNVTTYKIFLQMFYAGYIHPSIHLYLSNNKQFKCKWSMQCSEISCNVK